MFCCCCFLFPFAFCKSIVVPMQIEAIYSPGGGGSDRPSGCCWRSRGCLHSRRGDDHWSVAAHLLVEVDPEAGRPFSSPESGEGEGHAVAGYLGDDILVLVQIDEERIGNSLLRTLPAGRLWWRCWLIIM